MQTYANGTRPTAAPTIEPYDCRAELDAWDDTIAALDAALEDAAADRRAIETETLSLERLEAGHVLSIDGGNAEQRKARLTLALADDARYQAAASRLAAARQRLLDAERRVCIAKERCRLIRASLALRTPQD